MSWVQACANSESLRKGREGKIERRKRKRKGRLTGKTCKVHRGTRSSLCLGLPGTVGALGFLHLFLLCFPFLLCMQCYHVCDMESARKCRARCSPGLGKLWKREQARALSQQVLWPLQLLALRNSFPGLQSRQTQELAITEFIRDDCYTRGKDATEISLTDVSRGD